MTAFKKLLGILLALIMLLSGVIALAEDVIVSEKGEVENPCRSIGIQPWI